MTSWEDKHSSLLPGLEEVAVGTVKGPGEDNGRYLLITSDNQHTKVGEFVHYYPFGEQQESPIYGKIVSRNLARSYPSGLLADPAGTGNQDLGHGVPLVAPVADRDVMAASAHHDEARGAQVELVVGRALDVGSKEGVYDSSGLYVLPPGHVLTHILQVLGHDPADVARHVLHRHRKRTGRRATAPDGQHVRADPDRRKLLDGKGRGGGQQGSRGYGCEEALHDQVLCVALLVSETPSGGMPYQQQASPRPDRGSGFIANVGQRRHPEAPSPPGWTDRPAASAIDP